MHHTKQQFSNVAYMAADEIGKQKDFEKEEKMEKGDTVVHGRVVHVKRWRLEIKEKLKVKESDSEVEREGRCEKGKRF